jgi:hypothetical protein
MVAFNFKAEFADKVASGVKRTTIRQTKRCSVGDDIQLYTGQRTKDCKKLGDVRCMAVEKITFGKNHMKIGKEVYDPKQREMIAHQEGFLTYADMHKWFVRTYRKQSFQGYIHGWGAKPAEPQVNPFEAMAKAIDTMQQSIEKLALSNQSLAKVVTTQQANIEELTRRVKKLEAKGKPPRTRKKA